MKHLCYVFIVAIAFPLFVACSSDNKTAELQAKVDSLTKSNQEKDKDIKEMTSFVSVISTSLDSIRVYEDSVLYGNPNSESPKVTREQVKQNLAEMKKLIDRQQQQLAQLRQQLETAKGENAENMKKMVEFYETQLKEKNTQIASLQTELNKKNIDISNLRTHVSSLTTSNQELEEKTEAQTTTLQVQSDMLNTAYVQIGTSKELKAKGLLSGGFLRKVKVDSDKLKEENFTKVDIRYYNDVKLNSKKPKVMTQMPSSSYSITNNGDGTSTLHISDPNSFWSVSNFLIIQL